MASHRWAKSHSGKTFRPALSLSIWSMNSCPPDLVAAVLDGRHPNFMNAQALRSMHLSPTWADQRKTLAEREARGGR